VRNRKYGHCERKEVGMCSSEEELLDPREGRGRVFIDATA
jgi:hypothetical protein